MTKPTAKQVLAPFDSIIGQGNAKTQLQRSVQSAMNDGDMLSPLILGEAGNGKTKIAKTYLESLKLAGVEVLSLSPDEFRTPETAHEAFDFMRDSKKWAFHIDECHLLTESKNRTVWVDAMKNLLMKMLDGNNRGKPVQVKTDVDSITFTPQRGTIIATTNFPDKLGKDNAFKSRFNKIELDYYSESELVEILSTMLEAKGFKQLNEKNLGIIARCGRGTARPIEKIVGQLELIHAASGKRQKTLNAEDIMDALIISRLYPRGLESTEIQILMMGEKQRLMDQMVTAALPKLETTALRRMKGYLYSCGFIHLIGGRGFETTKRGRVYLEEIAKQKFPLPEIAV